MTVPLLLDQPDLLEPSRARRLAFPTLHAEGVRILNARGRNFEGGGDDPALSLKWIPQGKVEYHSAGRTFRIGQTNPLLLNRGQPYRLHMRQESESFIVFLPCALTDAAWQSVRNNTAGFPEVPSVAGPVGPRLQHVLRELRAECRSASPHAETLNELLLAVLDEIVTLAVARRASAASIPALRQSTREELLRRLARAEYYLVESSSAATLEGAASAAALSRFHLIRLFRAVHGETPLAYAAGIRLDQARDALLMTTDGIEEVARRAGYESRTAFDRAFRRRFGATPGRVRVGR